MQARHPFFLILGVCLAVLPALPVAVADEMADRLLQTRALNIGDIVDGQFTAEESGQEFRVIDPYSANAAGAVEAWYRDDARAGQVCAVRFVEGSQSDYRLSDFTSAADAKAAGYTLTHQGRCGSCSTLQDLAVYLAVPDLVTPARACARKSGLQRKAACFEDTMGFTPYCAQSWAYNARNTREHCMGICLSDYGFLNLLFRRYPGENADDSGRLRPCLQCDEDLSGPGFKYSAGRTRRNSGIESSIRRPQGEIYPVDHSAYFRQPAGNQPKKGAGTQ